MDREELTEQLRQERHVETMGLLKAILDKLEQIYMDIPSDMGQGE